MRGATVYILRSHKDRERYYVGVTRDLYDRIARHNAGLVPHSSKHRPWFLHVAIYFADAATATAFERHLKTGSGRAFAKRHFAPPTRDC
jgi:predicted GIY-YIG superfamily endonuclease